MDFPNFSAANFKKKYLEARYCAAQGIARSTAPLYCLNIKKSPTIPNEKASFFVAVANKTTKITTISRDDFLIPYFSAIP